MRNAARRFGCTASSPRIGAALLLAALILVIADAATGVSLGRLLTYERASRNVVSETGPRRRARNGSTS